MNLRIVQLQLRSWLWIASIWFGLGIFAALQTVFVMRAEGMHHAWVTLFVVTVLSWLPWALATPLVLRLGRKFPSVQWRRLSLWFLHLSACIAIGLLFAVWSTWLEVVSNAFANPAFVPVSSLWFDKFCNGMLSSLLLYATILTAGYVLDSREQLARQQAESARLSEQLTRAQLHALRQQIEPHFLFNTLNAIAGLVRENKNEAAVNMIAKLSDFMRRVLEDGTRQQVPLAEEMEFVQKYMDIQKVRFADRLQLYVNIGSELYPAQIPSLILQPMVENAVKHGIAKRAEGGAIRITASQSEGKLTVTVCNDGPQLPPDWEMTRSGIGISNVRTRLQSLYGDHFELSMRSREAGGVDASFSLPLVMLPVFTKA